jgi:dTDP-4-amino-4,6-dideoxygalactose transaminase
MTTLTWQRHRGHASSYDVVDAGFNYRLDEVRAALAIVQLERLHDANAARRRLSARYRELLAPVPGVSVAFEAGDHEHSSHHLAVAVLAPEVDRDETRMALQSARVQTSVHYPPIHRFTYYGELGRRRALPVTDDVSGRIVTLPLFPHMTDEQVELVSQSLADHLAAL